MNLNDLTSDQPQSPSERKTSEEPFATAREEGGFLPEELLDMTAGGANKALHSFTCPACGEQVYFYDNDRPYSCPHCGMHC